MSQQKQIIRQSTLKFVAEYLRLVNTPLPLNETVGITEVLVDYVENGRTKEVIEKLNRFDHYLSDKVVKEIADTIKFNFKD